MWKFVAFDCIGAAALINFFFHYSSKYGKQKGGGGIGGCGVEATTGLRWKENDRVNSTNSTNPISFRLPIIRLLFAALHSFINCVTLRINWTRVYLVLTQEYRKCLSANKS